MFKKWIEYRAIKKSGLFDPAYYLLNNADVGQVGIDPLLHYLESGWKEDRDPSPEFDTSYYLQTNPDVKNAGINPLIHYLRNGQKEGRSIHPSIDPEDFLSVSSILDRAHTPVPAHQVPVEIIVCVHNALEDVEHCLHSIVAHTSEPYRLTLVNDGSGAETSEYLEGFAKSHGATLIVNPEARGYTHAANQGLQRSTSEYVLLLNSDTILSEEWLDRMCACLESDPKTGIVGPLSNTASWQSIPEIYEGQDWAANPLPNGLSIEAMAAMLARRSRRLYPEMKLLNGFCLLIRRQLLDEVGLFDEETFGDGYGEEDDYVLRARTKDWKLALADDVYIYHAQSKSYSHERRMQLTARAGKALAEKHGQGIIDSSCDFNLNSPVLIGIRARSKVMLERENLIRQGQKTFGGKRILLAAGEEGNVLFSEAAAMIKMGVEVRAFNLEENRSYFYDRQPDVTIPVTFGSEQDLAPLTGSYDAVVATDSVALAWLKPIQNSKDRPTLGLYVQGSEPFPSSPDALAQDLIPFTRTLRTREQILRNIGVECTQTGVGIDIDLFRPYIRHEHIDRPIMISASIFPHHQGARLTMQVLRKVSQRYGSQVEIRLFGTTLDHPEFGKLPLDFPWKLAGQLNPSQLAAFFNTTDIYVDLSGYPAIESPALEAMACGNAVVVAETSDMVEYGRPGENCLVVNDLSLDTCLDTINKLIENKELFKRLQKNGVQDVCAFYLERPAYNILKVFFSPG